ncbi:MAG TPA: class I tRNA ligase family protein, partial [Solirubrobacteraceae bacterium]|nr:class I tRNA ligase family protein [Solirubrobacteraceae bacterium]
KLLNASKFALADLPPAGEEVTHALDRALLARLASVIADATESLEEYDYTRALERTETSFWWYCDYYLELVKARRYDPSPPVAASVSRALRSSLSVFQRLFAPFLPFVAEEVWSWWQPGSVHHAPWPQASELAFAAAGEQRREEQALAITADVLREVRKAKSQAGVKMRAPVERVLVRDSEERLSALELGSDDLVRAGVIAQLDTAEGEELAVEVQLGEEAA